MKTILVATDYSNAAKNAADYAAAMASCIHADLHLLHVYELPFVYNDVPVAMTYEELVDSSKKSLEELKAAIQQKTNNSISITTEVIMGDFFDTLVRVCKKIQPYTVVMGSQGKTAAEKLLVGTHATHAIKFLEYPLITVPPSATFKPIQKIGLACDFSDVTETVPVDEIEYLVHEFNAQLHVFNVSKPGKYDPEITFEARVLKNKLDEMHTQYHFLTHKNIDEGIIDFVDSNKIDLLVILPKLHGIAGLLLHKSHSKQLVLHSHVPVIALHHHAEVTHENQ